jgi:hypothetical protein
MDLINGTVAQAMRSVAGGIEASAAKPAAKRAARTGTAQSEPKADTESGQACKATKATKATTAAGRSSGERMYGGLRH